MRTFPKGRQKWGGVLAACLVGSILFSCGIDQKDETTQSGTTKVPDLTGVWEGEFVSAETGTITKITRLTVIKSQENEWAFDFDIELTPSGFFLWFWTNRESLKGTIDNTGNLFLQTPEGTMTINAHVESKSHIEGQWLLRAGIEDDGTWAAKKVQSLTP